MLKIISNKFKKCNHTPPIELGIARVIPIVVVGIDKFEVKKAIKFIQDEYDEYFQIVKKNNLFLNNKISKIIFDYQIDIIFVKAKKIILFKKNNQEVVFLRREKEKFEIDLINICNELIASYRNNS